MFDIVAIAQICHEANRALCNTWGDDSQRWWHTAEQWQRDSAISSVKHRQANLDAPISASHDHWMEEKRLEGWVYGEKKDPVAKTHPCLVPFEDLPPHQQVKDKLFVAIVRALSYW